MRWANLLLFPECVKAKAFSLVNKSLLAERYMFSNATALFRPLWTYVAKAIGRDVSLYYYSTNIAPLPFKGKHPSLSNDSIHLSSWDNIFAWNSYQKDYLSTQLLNNPTFMITNPIQFTNSTIPIQKIPPRTVSLFDVQPTRLSLYHKLGIHTDYYTVDTSVKFLSDCIDSLLSLGFHVAIKPKRPHTRFLHPKYRAYLNSLGLRENIHLIDPSYSAAKLIQSSCATISLPFSSTALISKYYDIPCCFYDPVNKLQEHSLSSHDINFIASKKILEEWIGLIY